MSLLAEAYVAIRRGGLRERSQAARAERATRLADACGTLSLRPVRGVDATSWCLSTFGCDTLWQPGRDGSSWKHWRRVQ